MIGEMIVRSLLFALLSFAPLAQGGNLPADLRLAETRDELQAIVDDVHQAGLPEEVIIDKVREGLAKGIPAARLLAVAREMKRRLVEARGQVDGRTRTPGVAIPSTLLRAIVEARAGGASPADVSAVLDVVAAGADLSTATRGVEALGDLLARGFPAAAAARAVAELARAPKGAGLAELAAEAARLWKQGGGPESALERAMQARSGASQNGEPSAGQRGNSDGRGPNREASGKRNPGRGKSR